MQNVLRIFYSEEVSGFYLNYKRLHKYKVLDTDLRDESVVRVGTVRQRRHLRRQRGLEHVVLLVVAGRLSPAILQGASATEILPQHLGCNSFATWSLLNLIPLTQGAEDNCWFQWLEVLLHRVFIQALVNLFSTVLSEIK